MVISSRTEGGASVIAEAIANRTVVIASHVDGNIGMLGQNYPGYYEYGNTDALRSLLLRAEQDRPFFRKLKGHCDGLRSRFRPTAERRSWREIIRQVSSA